MNLNNVQILDIESSGLLSDMLDYSSFPYKLKPSAKLWCIVIRNVGTNEIVSASNENITKDWLKDSLKDCKYLVAHNGIKFDFIVLKLFGIFDYKIGYLDQTDTLFDREIKFIDTLLLSRLLNPDRYGGHSLDSWGERVGNKKTDFRKVCIEENIISKDSLRGQEFLQYSDKMLEYCVQDTDTNRDTFLKLVEEMVSYKGWLKPFKMETKLADLAIKREVFGFFFDKKLALECLEDLSHKMQTISESILPILPPKKMNKGELDKFIPPKNQFKKDGSLSSHLIKFVDRLGAEIYQEGIPTLIFEGNVFKLPCESPLKTHTEASMKDLDHIKMYLIELGWVPLEWRERDLTKDVKKQSLPYEKRIEAAKRWVKETLDGKYRDQRLEIAGINSDFDIEKLYERLREDRPVRVPTSPCVRVGVEKDLCPNLIKLGDKVSFAGDFAMYLTYKHRKSSIAGGDIEDMDFDLEYPNTGFLSCYREVDGRIPTPAIEIGAATSRYRHISVSNIPRITSEYGDKMRALFGAGKGLVQVGFDFASLEARIEGHYIWKYEGGPEMSVALLAEKPNDIHTITGIKNNIDRNSAKSLNYMVLYGAAPPKIAKSLGISLEKAKGLYNSYWESVPALKTLKDNVTEYWEKNDKKHIMGIDGRLVPTRSPHSLLNALFQSGGVICAKYVTVFIMEQLESLGYITDPFEAKPDIACMIEYHDEANYAVDPKILKFKTFSSKEEAKEFVTNWRGAQLSAISHGKKWYVCLPNDLSTAIEESIKRMENLLNLNVPLGFEFIVGNNWAECH